MAKKFGESKKLASDASMRSRGETERGSKGKKSPNAKMPKGKTGREY